MGEALQPADGPGAWRRFGALLAALAALGTAAPYLAVPLGLEVNVPAGVEVVDHVVPGAVLLAVAGSAIAARTLPLAAALTAVLASFWMAATHVPLLADGDEPLGAALWHSLPGFGLLALSTAAAAYAWRYEAAR